MSRFPANTAGDDGVPGRDPRWRSSSAGAWRLERSRRLPPLATSDITTVLESVVPPLRRLDDAEGGNAATIAFIHGQIITTDGYLTTGRMARPGTRERLVSVAAQLNQLAGWMAFDAERHRMARRYFTVALDAAHGADSPELAAHVLSCLTYQAVHRGDLARATEFVTQAARVAETTGPAVRSLVHSRLAYVHAAAGEVSRCHSAAAKARSLLDRALADSDLPEWLYWYDHEALDWQTGHSMLIGALRRPIGSATLMAEAERLLGSRLSAASQTPRDALFHGGWLARSHAKRGEPERAVAVGEAAINQTGWLFSRRVRNVFRALDSDLNQRGYRKLPEVRALHRRLRQNNL